MATFDVHAVQRRLAAANGGYELVHRSAGLELGVYVLLAPEPDRQQRHEDDEVYLVLEGSGVLELAGESRQLEEGQAAFVAAGVEHRFSGYERLSLFAIFARGHATAGLSFEATPGAGDSEGGAPYWP